MTAQMPDTLIYQGKRYSLFDVSDGKVLSCKRCVGKGEDGSIISACWRGSIATYEVSDGSLILREVADMSWADLGGFLTAIDHPDLSTRQLDEPIPFTGHLLITLGGNCVDFFTQLFDAEVALELEFKEGRLVGEVDLSPTLEVGRRLVEENRLTDPEDDVDDFIDAPGDLVRAVAERCHVAPVGWYSGMNYVWLEGDVDCALCASRNSEPVN